MNEFGQVSSEQSRVAMKRSSEVELLADVSQVGENKASWWS